jgi:hypothetical protein
MRCLPQLTEGPQSAIYPLKRTEVDRFVIFDMVLVKSEDCLYFEEVYTYTSENDCS